MSKFKFLQNFNYQLLGAAFISLNETQLTRIIVCEFIDLIKTLSQVYSERKLEGTSSFSQKSNEVRQHLTFIHLSDVGVAEMTPHVHFDHLFVPLFTNLL